VRSFRLGLMFCAGAAALTACSGGGSGPSPNGGGGPAPTATPTASAAPTPTPTPPGSLTPAVERQVAQADLSAVRPILIESQLEQGLSAASFARKPLFARARRMLSGSCSNGTEYSFSTNGITTKFTLDVFYDAACTMPWQKIAGQEVTSATSGGPAEKVTATDIVDGTNGLQVEYDAIDGTITETKSADAFAFTAATGPTVSVVKGQLGADCTVMSTGSNLSETCSFGGLAALPAFMGYTGFGTVIDETATTVAQSEGYTEYGGGSGTFFEGAAPPVMQLNNNGTTVSIANATVQKTLTETESIVAGSGAVPTVMLTVTDASDNAIVILNVAGTTITGKIENATTLAVVATFTLDLNGNGTITYSNGTMGTVSGFGITS
jgi:hypothetical protein